MFTVQFTKEEIEALVIRIGAIIDDLQAIQKQAGKKEDINRVLELEKFMIPIKSGNQKLIDTLCEY